MRKIAVLSGKGGVGKTFVSANLAASRPNAVYVDCDVEEPNGALFLQPTDIKETSVFTTVPKFNTDTCIGCRKCADFCQFHALAFLKGKPLLFPEICHACGGCGLVCPVHAVQEEKKEIGVLQVGKRDELSVVTGKMHLGEASGTKIIAKAIKRGEALAKQQNGTLWIDCPPGSACTVMESMAPADFCLIVAEPTAFGFHNFKMVHELTKVLKKPCGVIINKEDMPYTPLETYCAKEAVPIFARIPFSREIATCCASGKLAVLEDETAKQLFNTVQEKLQEVAL